MGDRNRGVVIRKDDPLLGKRRNESGIGRICRCWRCGKQCGGGQQDGADCRPLMRTDVHNRHGLTTVRMPRIKEGLRYVSRNRGVLPCCQRVCDRDVLPMCQLMLLTAAATLVWKSDGSGMYPSGGRPCCPSVMVDCMNALTALPTSASGYLEQTISILLASYEIVCSKYTDADVGKAVRAFMQSTITEGQQGLPPLGYIPLPSDFQTKVAAAVNNIS